MSSLYPKQSQPDQLSPLAAIGLEQETPALRRTPDGAIDTGYYLRHAGNERALATKKLARAIG